MELILKSGEPIFCMCACDPSCLLLSWALNLRIFCCSGGVSTLAVAHNFGSVILTLILMKCGALKLSRYFAGENVRAFLHDDFSLVCTEFWSRCICELHNRVSCCEPSSLIHALVKYYHNRPWCDRVKPSFATHMAFCLPLLLGFQTWNETRLVKDCSFTAWLFIGVLAVIYSLSPRLRFCVIAAACSATSSSGFCFLNRQPGYTFWSSVM